MQGSGLGQLNTRQIEKHLKSAVDTLTPNILEQIDFSVPQIKVSGQRQHVCVWCLSAAGLFITIWKTGGWSP